MNTLEEHFRPQRRAGRWLPEKDRISAAVLAARIGSRKAAWVFGVTREAVNSWRRAYGA